jgi:hypothetical protein
MVLYFGFDVMANLAFNKSINMLRSGKEHFVIQMLREAMGEGAMLNPIPWLVNVLLRCPFIPQKQSHFIGWCKQQAEERKKVSIPSCCFSS